MQLLVLTQVLPYPPDSGPKVKTLNMLRYLVCSHDITLVSFTRGDQTADCHALEQWCSAIYTVPIERGVANDAWHLAASLLTGHPFLMQRDRRAAMHRLLAHLSAARHFDAVHADQLNMAQYAVGLPIDRKVLDTHNALWLLYQRLWHALPASPFKLLLAREWPVLRRYEGRMCGAFDAVLAVSEADRRALEAAAGSPLPISVVPLSVDADLWRSMKRHTTANRLLHIGSMDWAPNVDGVRWFMTAVLPQIRAQLPSTPLDIVGARPPRTLRTYAAATPGVHLLGYVADPTPHFEQAAVMVVPLRAGSGMRAKILTAMAAGIPVVSTQIGCEGIAAVDGEDVLIADSSEQFASAVVRVLRDRDLATRLSHNGRRLIERRYDYRVACRPLDDVYPPGARGERTGH